MHLENAAVLYIYTWLGPLYKMMTVYTLKIKLSLCVLYIFTSTLDLFSLLAMTNFHLGSCFFQVPMEQMAVWLLGGPGAETQVRALINGS